MNTLVTFVCLYLLVSVAIEMMLRGIKTFALQIARG